MKEDYTIVKYGEFIVLDEEFAIDTKWFDDTKNVVDFLRILALKKDLDRDLSSMVSK